MHRCIIAMRSLAGHSIHITNCKSTYKLTAFVGLTCEHEFLREYRKCFYHDSLIGCIDWWSSYRATPPPPQALRLYYMELDRFYLMRVIYGSSIAERKRSVQKACFASGNIKQPCSTQERYSEKDLCSVQGKEELQAYWSYSETTATAYY